LKSKLLPFHSRQIAEAHYKLSLVLDLTSGRLGDAIEQVKKAIGSIDARIAILVRSLESTSPSVKGDDVKGKGKAVETVDLTIAAMSQEAIANELKEFGELKTELSDKIEDLKSSPEKQEISAPAQAAKELANELSTSTGSSLPAGPIVVNDLSSMVKKKKKPVDAATSTSSSNGKRKADDEGDDGPEGKRAKANGSVA